MADSDVPTNGPTEGEPAPSPTPAPTDATVEQTAVAPEPAPAAPAAPAGPRFTERVWNFRAMVAVALAALLLGGGLGAAITAVSRDDDSDRRPGFGRFGDGPGFPGGPGQLDRQQFRKDLRDMRKRMKQHLEQEYPPAPAPATPSPTKTS